MKWQELCECLRSHVLCGKIILANSLGAKNKKTLLRSRSVASSVFIVKPT